MASGGRFKYAEFAYDWRQDLFLVAEKLGAWLAKDHDFALDDRGKQLKKTNPCLIIVGHSMGCLVAALAMMEGYIHPANMHRFICIGAPFLGAPAAFRALYSIGYLPNMRWVEKWVGKGKDKRARQEAILETFQSFFSGYQLLPNRLHTFVWIRGDACINPLAGEILPSEARTATEKAHQRLAQLEDFLSQNDVPYRFIYGVTLKRGLARTILSHLIGPSDNLAGDTDDQFYASIGTTRTGSATYVKVRERLRTVGDGTVPVNSATNNNPDGRGRLKVVGVPHTYMCDDGNVVELVSQCLT